MTARPADTFPVVDGPLFGIAPLQIGVPINPLIANFSTRFFSVGSCFAVRVAAALGQLSFQAFADATVTTHFSSRSLAPQLARWVEERPYRAEELYRFPGTDAYLSPFHKQLSAHGPGAATRLLGLMHDRDREARTALAAADVVFLTLGSSTYLQLRDSGAVLAYGAGIPTSDHWTLALSLSELAADLEAIHGALKRLCHPGFHLVLTVSPQRYNWPVAPATSAANDEDALGFRPGPERHMTPGLDPVVYSNLDKAKLRAALDEFVRHHAGERVEYFPAYDIVMDELRSYETFSNNYRDSLHVAFPATSNYVINRFLLSHCTPAVIEALQDFRRGFVAFERALQFDQSAPAQANARAFVQKMRSHADAVGCHGLYGRVRGALAQKHAEPLVPVASPVASPVPAPAFSTIRGALARLERSVAVWTGQGKRIAIYGGGRHTRLLLNTTNLGNAPIAAVVDDYPEADRFEGIPLVRLEELEAFAPDVIIVSSVDFQTRMVERLGKRSTLVWPIYQDEELALAQQSMVAFEAESSATRASGASPHRGVTARTGT